MSNPVILWKIIQTLEVVKVVKVIKLYCVFVDEYEMAKTLGLRYLAAAYRIQVG